LSEYKHKELRQRIATNILNGNLKFIQDESRRLQLELNNIKTSLETISSFTSHMYHSLKELSLLQPERWEKEGK
jgi:hypothetical protein